MLTRNEIRNWLDRGLRTGATHMLVVCDTFSYEDFPVFVKVGENSRDVVVKYDGVNMQTVQEVYDLSKDIDEQLEAHRVWNL